MQNQKNTHARSRGKEQRKVAVATVIGTTVEWYDYFIYGAAAGLVFNRLFFSDLGSGAATIIAFATIGISFLFRPLGAFLAGHFGDRLGRRFILVVTLIGMGSATALIGLLPSSESIGITAPILLILLRVIQGVSAGGEWGGAALMAVEHAPTSKRGLYGSLPQIGVPMGLLLSSAMLGIMNQVFPGDMFYEWGWRIPFLFSVLLIGIGYWTRRNVEESPVFKEISQRQERVGAPVSEVFKRYSPLVFFAALILAGNNAVGYMTTGGYIQSYASNPNGPVALDRGAILWAVTFSGVTWLLFSLLGGWLSDQIGRKSTYIIGWICLGIGTLILFPLVNTANIYLLTLGLVQLSLGLGLTYGALSAWYTELFPASVRFSGVSVSYAGGSIIGGAFAPFIAETLYNATGGTVAVTVYLFVMVLLGLLGTMLLRERKGIELGPGSQSLQENNIYVFER